MGHDVGLATDVTIVTVHTLANAHAAVEGTGHDDHVTLWTGSVEGFSLTECADLWKQTKKNLKPGPQTIVNQVALFSHFDSSSNGDKQASR